MDDIEKMNQHYRHANPVGQFRASAGKFGCDLLELAELQGRLFKADTRSAVEHSVGATIFVLLGCLSLLGCMPVLVLGIASAIAYCFEIEHWLSQLAVGGVLSLFSVAVITVSLMKLSKSGNQFRRSTEEFAKNIVWAKEILGGVSSN